MSRQGIVKFTNLFSPKASPLKYTCCLHKDAEMKYPSVQFFVHIYIAFKIFISTSKSHYGILGNYRKAERRNPEITSNTTL